MGRKKINFIKDSNNAKLLSNMYNLENLTMLKDIKKSTKISRLLSEQYKEVRNLDWFDKITITIINCLLTQNRKVFLLNRDYLLRLVKNDTNHYSDIGFQTKNYKALVNHLSKFICKIEKVKRHKQYVLMCTVFHTDLLNLIEADILEQEKELRNFISENSTKDVPDLYQTSFKFRKSVPT